MIAKDNLVDGSLVIIVISEGDLIHICLVLLLVIEVLEILSPAVDNLVVLMNKITNSGGFGDFVLVFLLIWS